MSHIAVANAYRILETANGTWQFPELRDTPPHLLGKMWHENNHMDSALNAAATENNFALLYGDFQNYVVVDRIGTRIELINNLVGSNQRPTGQRGVFVWYRVGGDSVVDGAFRMLDIPTAA
jgi:HK97 family phage major capsid protein